MRVAEPPVQGPVRAQVQLRQRLQDGGIPRRQVPRLPAPLLLQNTLPPLIWLINLYLMPALHDGWWLSSFVLFDCVRE